MMDVLFFLLLSGLTFALTLLYPSDRKRRRLADRVERLRVEDGYYERVCAGRRQGVNVLRNLE
jgi:hypothetical protein